MKSLGGTAWLEEDDGKGGKRRRARKERKGTPQGSPLGYVYMRRFVLGWKTLGYAQHFCAEIVNFATSVVMARGADYDALLAAVFTLVSLVGLFSPAFIRGAFTLRAAADGKPGAERTQGTLQSPRQPPTLPPSRARADGKPGASGPMAFAHMAGGIAAWHIVAVIEAVQTSLGIAVLNIR